MGYKVAVVGATGNVGRETLVTLEEKKFPVAQLVALASNKSKGKKLSFGNKIIRAEPIEDYDFNGTDIAIFAAGSDIARQYAPVASKSGCVVIDHSSYYRNDKKIPLIVPEVNADKIGDYINSNIIANPNCTVIPLMVVLKPLNDQVRIKRIVTNTYQSVSGAGKGAMDELFYQTKGKFTNDNIPNQYFDRQIAFNVIPKIDELLEDGDTKEEWKIRSETQKILDNSIQITSTCVRVPVFVGHSCAVNIEFEDYIDYKKAIQILNVANGVAVMRDIITPIECVGEEHVYVSRIRNDNSCKNSLNMWIVSDNLRKGAALNAVQIAQILIEKYL